MHFNVTALYRISMVMDELIGDYFVCFGLQFVITFCVLTAENIWSVFFSFFFSKSGPTDASLPRAQHHSCCTSSASCVWAFPPWLCSRSPHMCLHLLLLVSTKCNFFFMS